MKGYIGDQGATKSTIDAEGWLHTGDVGFYDEEGYFFITDRLKRMINASGFKVWPAEVEALLFRHPAVQEACIIAARDAYRGETVKAVVVLRADAKVTELELRQFCAISLAAFKVPRHIVFLEAIPRTSLGKLQRTLLAQQFQNARTAQTAKA